jgi:succinate dehydrogenase/fumarate reductase cytochrome b subunit (b558 family)
MRRHFYLRRLHSLAGVVPLGVFLAEHLWTNAHAVFGRDAFNRAVGEIQAMPMLAYVELVGIVLPLAYHAAYGLVVSAQGSVNVGRYGYARNWMYVLQRVTGVVAVAFIALHLWQYRVRKLTGALAWQDFYQQLGADLNTRWIFAFYVAGVSATVFHFANGLWLFGNTWGITVSPTSQRRAAWVCGAVGVALWALGVNTLLHFAWRCGGVIPMPEQSLTALCAGVR